VLPRSSVLYIANFWRSSVDSLFVPLHCGHQVPPSLIELLAACQTWSKEHSHVISVLLLMYSVEISLPPLLVAISRNVLSVSVVALLLLYIPVIYRKKRIFMVETYISVDVETNGPIPGPYSMLSLGLPLSPPMASSLAASPSIYNFCPVPRLTLTPWSFGQRIKLPTRPPAKIW
jgi:hypothetical protein